MYSVLVVLLVLVKLASFWSIDLGAVGFIPLGLGYVDRNGGGLRGVLWLQNRVQRVRKKGFEISR